MLDSESSPIFNTGINFVSASTSHSKIFLKCERWWWCAQCASSLFRAECISVLIWMLNYRWKYLQGYLDIPVVRQYQQCYWAHNTGDYTYPSTLFIFYLFSYCIHFLWSNYDKMWHIYFISVKFIFFVIFRKELSSFFVRIYF